MCAVCNGGIIHYTLCPLQSIGGSNSVLTAPLKVEEKKTCSIPFFDPLRLKLILTVVSTEYTQSGNGRFLSYIPSWWKNLPRLGRVGGARPPPFTKVTFMYKVAVYAPAERPAKLPPYFYYAPMYSVAVKLGSWYSWPFHEVALAFQRAQDWKREGGD